MARWLTYATLDPLDPDSGHKTEVKIPGDLADHLYKCRTIDFFNLATVAKVLDAPERIYYGLRQLQDGWWCYVWKPNEWYLRDRVLVPFPKNMVYAVYMQKDLIIYSFRAEYADKEDPLHPENWKERYQRLVWKRSP